MERVAPVTERVRSGSRALVELEDPWLGIRFEAATVLMFLVCAVLETTRDRLLWISVVAAPLCFFASVWARRHTRRVRAEIDGDRLALRAGPRTFRIRPQNVARLCVEHHPCRLRVLLCDGRIVTVRNLDARLAWRFESMVAKCRGPETFKLAGVPKRGRLTRWISALPLLPGFVRPRLRIQSEALRIAWGPFSLKLPLCQLTHASATGSGVLLRASTALEVELCTYGGLQAKWDPVVLEFNELVAERIIEARRRALSRSLASYRRGFRALALGGG